MDKKFVIKDSQTVFRLYSRVHGVLFKLVRLPTSNYTHAEFGAFKVPFAKQRRRRLRKAGSDRCIVARLTLCFPHYLSILFSLSGEPRTETPRSSARTWLPHDQALLSKGPGPCLLLPLGLYCISLLVTTNCRLVRDPLNNCLQGR